MIAHVRAGDGYQADQHSFVLTPQGTALITAYHETRRDVSVVGGSPDGKVYDGIVQEIDVASGRVLFEWHSLDHVPLDESYQRVPKDPNRPYDYFHINSVGLDHDGNLLISSRHTWTVYKVDRHTGQIVWRLGGKRSDFEPGLGVPFAWQHDPVSAGRDTLRIFDNESNGTPLRPQSRVITLRIDPQERTATLLQSIEHPDGLSVPSQGSSERLPNGNLFVGWGRLGRFSEFGADERLLFDATLPPGYDSYRAYRFPWTGQPTTPPTASAAPGRTRHRCRCELERRNRRRSLAHPGRSRPRSTRAGRVGRVERPRDQRARSDPRELGGGRRRGQERPHPRGIGARARRALKEGPRKRERTTCCAWSKSGWLVAGRALSRVSRAYEGLDGSART